MSNKKKKYGLAFRIYIIVIIAIVLGIVCLIVQPGELFKERRMVNVCYEQVKDRLNAPSTAIFSKTEIKNHHVWGPVVYGLVESQNGFGGMGKHEYYCYYWDKDGNGKFWDVAFENKGDGDEIFWMIDGDF